MLTASALILTFVTLPKIAVLPAQLDESAKNDVPKLIDDYILTAAHDAGGYEVIGQDDLNAMLGFEQQRDLLGCDDASCMAQIGGALGVDYIVAFKVARLGNDWAITGKMIDIKKTKVQSRISEFVRGDTKELLKAMPGIARKLLGGTTAAVRQDSDGDSARPVDDDSSAPREATPAGPADTSSYPSGIYANAGLGIIALIAIEDVAFEGRIEVGYRFESGFELGVGFFIPDAVDLNVRWMFLRGGFELGVFLAPTIIFPTAGASPETNDPLSSFDGSSGALSRTGFALYQEGVGIDVPTLYMAQGGLSAGVLFPVGPFDVGGRLSLAAAYVPDIEEFFIPVTLSAYAVF